MNNQSCKLQVKSLPSFTVAVHKRAQTAINIILNNPCEITSRKYDQCFEMTDGKDVALIIMHTFISSNIRFEQLPIEVQNYLGLKFWDKLEDEYNKVMQMQTTMVL